MNFTSVLSFFLLIQLSQGIDTGASIIDFQFPAKKVEGTIGDVQSDSEVNTADFTQSRLKGSVSLESLKTGNFLRDWHLMAAKYFNRKAHDRLYFESSSIRKSGEGYVVSGTLTIKGIENEVEFDAGLSSTELTLEGQINIRDWEIEIMKEYDENTVDIRMVFVLK